MRYIHPNHFIELPRTPFTLRTPFKEIFFSIKWPVQVKPLKKQNLCWTGHFIEKKISLEKFLRGEWGSWARRARARQKGCQIGAILARAARGATRTPFTPRTPFKESVLEAFSAGGGGIKWPVQHRFGFTIDSVNDFDIDICLAVGFVRFRSHSKSFGFPIDEIDDIPPRFERGPSTL